MTLHVHQPAPSPAEADRLAYARQIVRAEAAALAAYAAAFVALLPPRPGVDSLLATLAGSRRLAVVSNWPHAPTIDRYLAAHGWDRRSCMRSISSTAARGASA